ncbi:MAG: sigma-54 dependent transcriptional regulator [Planctomycetota bacterium]
MSALATSSMPLARSPRPPRVLVVDDEESMRWFLRQGLERHGFQVETAPDADRALRLFREQPFAAAVVDVRLPGADGLHVLEGIRARETGTVVVMITAFGSIPAAVDAMRRGAHDYIAKPFEVGELAAVLERALAPRTATEPALPDVVADSPAMAAVMQQVEQVRDATVNVLITGESGTGKELVARLLHGRSARASGPFVAINCAALPEALIASELFGHEPGAFTGAVGRRTGLLVRADTGTLFLDEVGELRPESQAKLERFLQEREVVPLGGHEPTRVDVRVCAATSRDLGSYVEEGVFRRELYFRLAVVPIVVPPLRERVDDIPGLVRQALQRVGGRRRSVVEGLSVEAMSALQSYSWPGNVRELQNLIERMVVLHGDKETIEYDDLPDELRDAGRVRFVGPYGGVVEYEHAIVAFERQYLSSILQRSHGNMSEAARIAGLSRGHLHRKVKQLGIDPDAYRAK